MTWIESEIGKKGMKVGGKEFLEFNNRSTMNDIH